MCGLTSGGVWYAADDSYKKDFEDDPELIRKIEADFQKPWGDRRIELVVIGIDLNQKEIEKTLDTCLLTPEELKLGPKGWEEFDDPFPKFEDDDEEDEEGED
uniref:CobW C-terminal domain-containing protein n=2 Tax=Lotharella globosa TaxID=91324 RepID=A0A7S3Z0U6_9EUKA|mmetsp:Transcript_9947/g.19118  ORF Transcript_9947/g.19118 Transcript_9947/m.19118 type:complete len:102 (-) Transcript_9947:93-398(-)